MSRSLDADVIIVGAGLSGLSAAKRLREHDVSVLVLEARDRVGGRTYTKQLDDFGWLDVGASYVGPAQKSILRLASEMGVKTYKVNSKGDYIFHYKGRTMSYSEQWPCKNPIVYLDCNNMSHQLDKLSRQVPVECPWTAAHADLWDRITVQQWLDDICWTSEAKAWGRQFVQSVLTVEPWEVSLLFVLWFVHSAGGVDSIWELDGAAQDSKFVGGSQQISERMAERLAGSVKLQTPVVEIRQTEDGTTVITKNGDAYKSHYVIVAIPPWLQASICYTPPLSASKRQLLQKMPMGACIKSETYYKRPFWRAKGLNGVTATIDNTMLVGDTIDDTRDDSRYPAITGFIMAGMAQAANVMTKEERKQQTLDCYSKLFGSEEALEPVHYEDFNWMEEPYTGGCFTSYCAPGVLTKYKGEIRAPHGRVLFAGTETATQWSGYMDGAVSAGQRAAGEVLHRLALIAESDITLDTYDQSDVASSVLTAVLPSVGGLITGAAVVCAVAVGAAIWWKYDTYLINVSRATRAGF